MIERVVRGGVLHDVQMQAISRERGHDGPVSVRRRFRRGEVADAEPVKGLDRVFGKIAAVARLHGVRGGECCQVGRRVRSAQAVMSQLEQIDVAYHARKPILVSIVVVNVSCEEGGGAARLHLDAPGEVVRVGHGVELVVVSVVDDLDVHVS